MLLSWGHSQALTSLFTGRSAACVQDSGGHSGTYIWLLVQPLSCGDECLVEEFNITDKVANLDHKSTCYGITGKKTKRKSIPVTSNFSSCLLFF